MFLEVELPGQEPKLVLNALLEVTDTLQVFLSESRSVLEGREWDAFKPVKNGNVFLKDKAGNTFQFDLKDRSVPWMEDFVYQLPNPGIQPGEEYEIFAEAEGYLSVSSSQTVPTFVPIKSIEYVNLGENPNGQGFDIYEITVKFDDLPGKNYYEIGGSYIGEAYYLDQEGDTIFYNFNSYLYPKPVNRIFEKDYLLRPVILFSDVLLGEGESQIVFRTDIIRGIDIDVNIQLSHVSEAYYRYYDTADLQYYNRGDFLAQPVLVFNNINQGLGIFKSRSTDRKSFMILSD